MAPIESKHASYVNRLTKTLVRVIGDAAIVSVQNPIILGDLSEPEPNFSLLKAKENDYEDLLPSAEDILLLIEISDTTVNYDMKIKAPLYARFHIPEFWLVNIQKMSITLYQKPIQGQYTVVNTHRLPPPFYYQIVKWN